MSRAEEEVRALLGKDYQCSQSVLCHAGILTSGQGFAFVMAASGTAWMGGCETRRGRKFRGAPQLQLQPYPIQPAW